jgi:hypothetical protein
MKRLSVIVIIFVASLVVSCGEFFSDMRFNASLNDGLVGYWPIIGNSTTQQDYSGKRNDMISDGSIVAGKFNTVYYIVNGQVAGTDPLTNIDLSTDDEISISFWVYRSTTGSNTNHVTVNPDINISTLGTSQIFVVGTAWASAPQLPLNSWQYVTGTYDGRTIRLYINGELAGETQSIVQLDDATSIGLHSSGTDNIYLDEVRIYNRVLSHDEIKELMTIGME